MKLTDFIDGLKDRLLNLAATHFEDDELQAKHHLLVGLHYELLKTMSLLQRGDDPYPLVVAIDIVQDIEQTSKEMVVLRETRASRLQ
jgi:hypothetical protein